MNVLYISHFVPWPPASGALQRNYNLIREVAKENRVHLITLTQKALLGDQTSLESAIANVKPLCASLEVFPIESDKSHFDFALLLLKNLFESQAYSSARFYSCAMQKAVLDCIANNAIDLIHIDTIDLVPYLPENCKIPAVLNHHNIESSLLFRRAQNATNPLVRWYARLHAKRLRQYEQENMPRFKDNLAVSPIDRDGFLALCPQAKVSVISNGTDTDFFTPLTEAQTPTLIFAGGLNWYPNTDSMIYFCSQILPLVVSRCPQVRLQIIGKDVPKALYAFAKQGLPVDILGFVPDIREYFAKAAIQIVPLRVGGGTRLKILDALAMGKAVVSTSIGAEGLELTDGADLLIADTEEAFADKITLLLANEPLRMQLGMQGRATVEKKYSWSVIGPKLCAIYKEIIG